MPSSFYWHDYETFGVDPRADRPAQFAGQRTDPDLNPVEQPLELWCRLSPDYLPHPAACGLTGIGPGAARRQGVCERDFITAIHREMARPETCSCGYNSLRFDDEVTRGALFRNLLDPYGREWQNGNSRWDLLDVMRLARAFRPEGLCWPDGEDGAPSFRLEHLTAANGIPHAGAHTALADVRATVALARLLATIDNPDAPEEEACDEYRSESGLGEAILISRADLENLIRAKAAMYVGCEFLLKKMELDFSRIDKFFLLLLFQLIVFHIPFRQFKKLLFVSNPGNC